MRFLGRVFESRHLGVVIETYRTDGTDVSQEGADPIAKPAPREHTQVILWTISRFELHSTSLYL